MFCRILNEDSAEAFEFFAAAASSGIEFANGRQRGGGNGDLSDVMRSSRRHHNAVGGMGVQEGQRQRHFSLEDYNEMHEYSGNESSNESFACADRTTSGGSGGNRNHNLGAGSTKMMTHSSFHHNGAGLNNHHQNQMHTGMQIDDPEHISFNGKKCKTIETGADRLIQRVSTQ